MRRQVRTIEKPGTTNLGAVLRELREATGVGRSEVARRLGVKYQTVDCLEKKAKPTLAALQRAVEALGGKIVLRIEV